MARLLIVKYLEQEFPELPTGVCRRITKLDDPVVEPPKSCPKPQRIRMHIDEINRQLLRKDLTAKERHNLKSKRYNWIKKYGHQ